MGSKNRGFISSRHVILYEASIMKPTVSRQMEMRKTKVVSQWMEADATPHCPVGSVSSRVPLVVTPGGDRVGDVDTEHVKKDGSDVARGTKGNP